MVGKYKDGNMQDLGTILAEVIAELKGIKAAVDEHIESDEQVDVNSEEYKTAYNHNYKLISEALAPFMGQEVGDVEMIEAVKRVFPRLSGGALWSVGDPAEDIKVCIEDMKKNTGSKGIAPYFESVDEYKKFVESRGENE